MILKGYFRFILQVYIFQTILVDSIYSWYGGYSKCEDVGPVKSFNITHVNSSHVMLEWTRPSRPEYCLSGYELSWSKIPDHPNNETLFTYYTSYAVNTLEPCTNYTFSIVPFGYKDRKISTNVRTVKVQTGPSEVKDLVVENRTKSSLTLTWKNAIYGLSCASYYELVFKPNHEEETTPEVIQLDLNQTSYKIDNLKQCVEYDISIVTKGNENHSKAQILATPVPEVLGPVESFNVTDITSNLVTLKWSKPTIYSECVEGYEIEWSDAGRFESKSVIYKTSRSTETSYTIHYIKPCTNYTFSILAFSAGGKSIPTNISATTAKGAPGKVRDLKVTNETKESITLMWKKPIYGFSCASHYELQCVSLYSLKRCTSQKTINLDLNQTSYTINNLESCKAYEIHFITEKAENLIDSAAYVVAKTVSEVPGPAESFNVTDVTSNKVVLKWLKPNNYSQCVENYVVKWSRYLDHFENEAVINKYNWLGNTKTIYNLKPCTNYTFSIWAVGNNVTSIATNISVTTAEAALRPVESFSATNVTSNQVTLKWSEPTEHSKCVEKYEIKWSRHPGNFENETIIYSSAYDGSYAIDNLEPCTNYTFSIWTVGAKGRSIATNVSITTTEGVPSEDMNFHVENKTKDSLTVTWNRPFYGLRCASQYELNYKLHYDEVTSPPIPTDLNQTSYTIDNLKPCVGYEISITRKGFQTVSRATINANTILEVPGPVRSLNITNVTLSSVSLKWSKPTSYSECVENYEIKWSKHPGHFDSEPVILPSYYRTHTINDLEPCTNYTFLITVVGVNGRSNLTYISTTTTDGGPGPVDSFKVSIVTSNQVTLKWSKPTVYSECVEGYEIKWFTTGGFEKVDKTAISNDPRSIEIIYTVDDLEPCTNYTFSIQTVGENSKRSIPTNVSIITSEAVPGPVESFEVTDVESGSVTFNWISPNKYPQCVDKYEIKWSRYPESFENTTAVLYNDSTSIEGSHTICNLEPFTNYTFSISAVGVKGISIPTNISITTAKDDYDYLAIYGEETTATSVAVMWYKSSGSSCPSRYELVYKSKNEKEYSPVIPIGHNQTSYTIDNLKPCVEYEIRISTNQSKTVLTRTSSVITRPEVPGPVESFNVTDVTLRSVTLKWSEPTEFPQCVKNYEIKRSKYSGRFEGQPVERSHVDRSSNIAHLEPCTNYTFSIWAVGNNDKRSNPTYISIATKEAPGKVRNFKVKERNASSITVGWDEPLDGSNCANKFELVYNDGQVISEPIIIDPHETNYTINNLKDTVEYEIGLRTVGLNENSEKLFVVSRAFKEPGHFGFKSFLLFISIVSIAILSIYYRKLLIKKLFGENRNWTKFVTKWDRKEKSVTIEKSSET